jgi:hypothetical protein
MNKNLEKTGLIKKILSIKSDWQEFIDLINRFISFDVPPTDGYKLNFSRTGLVRFYDQLTIVVDRLETTSSYFLLERNKIKNFVFKNGRKVTYETPIISFTNVEKTTGKHEDIEDVLYVQFIGSVAWKVWEEKKEKVYILNPGDGIFVQKNTYHEVRSITPRAGISFTVI